MNINLKIDFRLVSLILLAVIVVMLGLWQPWSDVDQRTVSVSGQANVLAEPDQYTFSTTYEKKADSSEEAVASVSSLGNQVVDKLKELGVSASDISTRVNVNSNRIFMEGMPSAVLPDNPRGNVAYFHIEAKVDNAELAEKVMEYIATTPVIHSVTPEVGFSPETRRKLETEARSIALRDARQRADQLTRDLGVRVGRVVSISDSQLDFPVWRGGTGFQTMDDVASSSSNAAPVIMPGKQTVSYTVYVDFRFR